MTSEQIAERLKEAMSGQVYQGTLTAYSAQSIEQSRSNYPVNNLLKYCQDSNIQMVLMDYMTEDMFCPCSVDEVHGIIALLMNRWQIDYRLVYKKTGIWYTAPRKMAGKKIAPLSIKTFLAVCETIHCDILFEPK